MDNYNPGPEPIREPYCRLAEPRLPSDKLPWPGESKLG